MKKYFLVFILAVLGLAVLPSETAQAKPATVKELKAEYKAQKKELKEKAKAKKEELKFEQKKAKADEKAAGKEKKRLEKQSKADEKKRAREDKAALKQQEKSAKAGEKLENKSAKNRAKAQKAANKEAQKQEKAQARLSAEQEKLNAKFQAKQAKINAKEEKEQNKLAAKAARNDVRTRKGALEAIELDDEDVTAPDESSKDNPSKDILIKEADAKTKAPVEDKTEAKNDPNNEHAVKSAEKDEIADIEADKKRAQRALDETGVNYQGVKPASNVTNDEIPTLASPEAIAKNKAREGENILSDKISSAQEKVFSGEKNPVIINQEEEAPVKKLDIEAEEKKSMTEKEPAVEKEFAAEEKPDVITADESKTEPAGGLETNEEISKQNDSAAEEITGTPVKSGAGYRKNLTYSDIDKNQVSINEFLGFNAKQNEKFSLLYFDTTKKLDDFDKKIKAKEKLIEETKKSTLSANEKSEKIKKLDKELDLLYGSRDKCYNQALLGFNEMLTKKQSVKWEILQQMGYRFFPETD